MKSSHETHNDNETAKKIIAGFAGVVGAIGLTAGLGMLIDKAVNNSRKEDEMATAEELRRRQQQEQQLQLQLQLQHHHQQQQQQAGYAMLYQHPPPFQLAADSTTSPWQPQRKQMKERVRPSRATAAAAVETSSKVRLKKATKARDDSSDGVKKQPAVRHKTQPAPHLTDCSHFLLDRCRRGDACQFRHLKSITELTKLCRDWPLCSIEICRFQHPKDLAQKADPTALANSDTGPAEERFVHYLWDIENCAVPRGYSAFDVVQLVRQTVGEADGLKERVFKCYCDPVTLSREHRLGLQRANVQVVDVPDRKPGAADRCLQLDLDRIEGRGKQTVVLISGDIDFVGKLNDLRYQRGFHLVLIHNKHTNKDLRATAHTCYDWAALASKKQESKPTKHQKEALHSTTVREAGLQCPECATTFATTSRLAQHQTAKEHWWLCSCNKTFDTAQGLRDHQFDKGHHTSAPPAPASLLKERGPVTARNPSRSEDNTTTATDLAFECHTCHQQFATPTSLSQHRSAKHGR